MNNKSLCRAIAAFDDAGLDVVRFEPEGSMALFSIADNGRKPINTKCEKAAIPEMQCEKIRFPGEAYDICRITGAADWQEAICHAQALLKECGNGHLIHVGDFLYVSFEVPAALHDGVKFENLSIESAKVQIVERTSDKLIFNFDEVIFQSAINARNTTAGGFSESALAKYLNNEFLDAMGIKDYLRVNNAGIHITLPTAHELFGDAEYWEAENNFTENAYQFNYYKNEKNRVRSFENETDWYWTSSPRASVASYFCLVHSNGGSHTLAASEVRGVAPAFCVA